jgi:tetratricopeptide (TPR) repeat protein
VFFRPRLQVFLIRLSSSIFLLGTLLVIGTASAQKHEQDPLGQHFSAAQTFQLAGDLEHAESEYRQVLTLALQRLGDLAAAEKGDSPEASHLLEEAVEGQPDYVEARVDLATVYFQQGKLDQAKAQASEAIKTDPRNARALHLRGNIAFAQGHFAEAAEDLHTAMGLQGDFETAYSLALAYLSLHKLAEATLLFDEVLNDMGSTPQLHVLLGRAYRETGYLEHAIREFKKAIELDPRYPRVHYYLALAYLAQGEKERFPEARALFEQELAINPKEFYSTYFLGIIHLEEREFPAAEDYLQRALRLQPDNPDPLLYLGQTYFETNHIQWALEALKRCVDLTTDPTRNNYQISKAYSMMGQMLIKTGKQEEGEAELKRAQELRALAFQSDKEGQEARENGQHDLLPALRATAEKPSFLENRPPLDAAELKQTQAVRAGVTQILGNAYNNLGVIRARQEQYAQAADYFQKAGQWTPTLPGLDRNWGLACFHARQFAQATAPLARQVAQQPGDAKARDALALSYFMANKYAEVIKTFRTDLSDLPDDPGVLYALGVSLVYKDDSASASRIFSRMLQQNPNVAEVHVLLGRANADQNQYSPALSEFSRALEIDPKAEGAHFGRGMILLHEGKIDDAVREFRAEVDSHPADTEAKYHLAYSLLMQQQKDEAFAVLTDVVHDKPEYAEAQYQLGKLLLERGDVKAAIGKLETAVRLDPAKDYGYYQLSLAYRRDGRMEDANRVLETYQKLKAKERGTNQP